MNARRLTLCPTRLSAVEAGFAWLRSDGLRLATFAVALLAIGLLVDVAAAQGLPETSPPEARIQRARPVWLGYVVMFLLTAVIIAISLMPSKRAHQD